MRRVSLAWYLGSALLLLACSDGNTDGVGCGAGSENCGGVCVAIGTCQTAVCPTGQISCNNACYIGTACPSGANVGGQTSVGQTTIPAGGQTPATHVSTGGTATNTSTSGTVAKGGTGSTSGTVAKGGAVSTGGSSAYVDTDPSTCSDTAKSTSALNFQYTKTPVPTNNPAKTYVAMANWWGAFNGQKVTLSGLGFTVQNPNNVVSTNSADPIGYPALFIGQYQDVPSKGSNLPKQVSTLTTIPTVFNTNVNSVNGVLNASMDVWFNKTADPLGTDTNKPTGGYLMVWQNMPNGETPRGNKQLTGQKIGNVTGTWDVWADNECVSYVSTSTQASLTFDLNDFIKHAVTNNKVIQSSWYLAVVFAGFEIWSGSSNAKLSQFCTKVN